MYVIVSIKHVNNWDDRWTSKNLLKTPMQISTIFGNRLQVFGHLEETFIDIWTLDRKKQQNLIIKTYTGYVTKYCGEHFMDTYTRDVHQYRPLAVNSVRWSRHVVWWRIRYNFIGKRSPYGAEMTDKPDKLTCQLTKVEVFYLVSRRHQESEMVDTIKVTSSVHFCADAELNISLTVGITDWPYHRVVWSWHIQRKAREPVNQLQKCNHCLLLNDRLIGTTTGDQTQAKNHWKRSLTVYATGFGSKVSSRIINDKDLRSGMKYMWQPMTHIEPLTLQRKC